MTIRTRFHPSEDGKTFTIQRHEDDVSPTLEWNKKLQTMPQKSESFHHIASIPAIVYEAWLIESGLPPSSKDFMRFVRRKLRDHDWLFLKTTDKRI